MLTLVEAHSFRSLRFIQQRLERFHVLVGPNASGKTTFLDVPAFLSDLVSRGLDEAIRARTQNPEDLLWRRTGEQFELAIEASIPPDRRASLSKRNFDTIRYEVAVGVGIERS